VIFRALSIGATSLLAQQKAIDVISQNIANANTPGYSRQRAELVSAMPDHVAGRDFGNGISVANVRRSVDAALTDAQTRNSELASYAKTLQQELAGIEAVFGNLDTPGLTSALDDFFQAQQQLANRPEDRTLRLNTLARAGDVTSRITDMRRQLGERQNALNQAISPLITEANALLDRIAELDRQISVNENKSILRGDANDLRDKRDKAVMDLSQLIPVRRVTTNDAGLLLQTPGGDLLLRDDTARHLKLGTGIPFGSIEFTDTGLAAAGLDTGGQIGALITLRDGQLAGYISQLDSLAANLVFTVNQKHVGGSGLTAVSSYTSGQTATSPTGTATAVDKDSGIAFSGQVRTGTFTIHVLDPTGTPVSPPGPGGATISITAGVTKLSDIANAINAVNGVGASIANGRLTIDGGTNRIAFTNDTSNFLAAYEINTFFHGSTANDITVDSAVSADAGRIATAAADAATSAISPGDNTIALAILSLRDTATSIDGSPAASPAQRAATLAGAYGLDAASARQQLTYREAEADVLSRQRQSISGVNVDEEMIKMISLQRAYEASAKVIQVSNQMLDSLLGLVR